jgi:hypothetical protein
VDEVLAQMPHISIADSSAPALGDDADAAQLLMDHIKLPVVDIERIERLAASPEQRSVLESMSVCGVGDVPACNPHAALILSLIQEASMHSEESVPGPRRAVKEVDADQEEAPLDEALAGQQMADSKYRKKMQGAVSELQVAKACWVRLSGPRAPRLFCCACGRWNFLYSKPHMHKGNIIRLEMKYIPVPAPNLPMQRCALIQSLLPDLADADRVGRATVFRNATVYIRTITGANADMRQENDVCLLTAGTSMGLIQCVLHPSSGVPLCVRKRYGRVQ